jgi:transcriptional regulator with XRE-family HTH domain
MRQTTVQKRLGRRICEMRKRRCLTQDRLAVLCRSHRTQIGKIERGEIGVSLNTIVMLAEALETTVSALFSNLA